MLKPHETVYMWKKGRNKKFTAKYYIFHSSEDRLCKHDLECVIVNESGSIKKLLTDPDEIDVTGTADTIYEHKYNFICQ